MVLSERHLARFRAAPPTDERIQSLKLAMLVRQASIGVGLIGLIGERLTVEILVAVVLLGASSTAGVLDPRFLKLLMRHPLLGLVDVLLVVAVLGVLGVDSPLAIAALSTAFLIGLLYPLSVACLLGPVLAIAYAAAAVHEHRGDTAPPFLLLYGLPVAFLCLVWIGHSVSRIYQAQQAAERELAMHVQAAAASDERARLAREMHDSLAKSLQGIAFGASALPVWVTKDGDRAQMMASDLAVSAKQAVQEARTLLTRMRTDQPQRPFHEVMDEVLRAWAAQHGHQLCSRLEPAPALGADARYELLAALGEALENVHRHAPGAPVEVTLEGSDEFATLTIRDQGPGFAPDILKVRESEGHFGVRGMRERLQEIGGTCRIDSRPGTGTTVILRVPLSDVNLLPPLRIRELET
ncbi:ATP-binding protein [Kineosporia sp. J2-2]|uniref:ATP-binding protein n=1 Tax=Kineosporia corallincola TaxID=2835133 RepID=A0ABS5TNF5_9ACTN|nr:ATP-binding protein [Kineosporia corallincola]MBT0772635.1 ATP-binding protein [Kineosporia corallincola]